LRNSNGWKFPHDTTKRAIDAGMWVVADRIVENSMWNRQQLTLPYRPSCLLRLRHNRTKYWCPMNRKVHA
jgi:hypothetical protein